MGVGISLVGVNRLPLNIYYIQQLTAGRGIKVPLYSTQPSDKTSKFVLYRKGMRALFYTEQGKIYTQRVPTFDVKISRMPPPEPISSIDITISLFPKETGLTKIFLLA